MKTCFSHGLSAEATEKLSEYGFDLIDPCPYGAPLTHSDLYVHITPENRVFIAENTSDCLKELQDAIIIDKPVGSVYPFDVPLNCVCTGRNLFCNKNTVSRILLTYYTDLNYNIVHVNQGYAKCAVVPLGDALITDDDSVASAAEKNGISYLKVSKGNVRLKGYAYGFIGGSAGVCDNTVFWNGDITSHPECDMILDYMRQKGFRSVNLTDGELYDIGSLLFL